jgi:hypothetical protein
VGLSGGPAKPRTWRDRWPAVPSAEGAAARQLLPERMHRTYTSVRAYQHDAELLAKDGWQVATVANERHRTGVVAAGARWWQAVLHRPASGLIVGYRRLR